MELQILLVREKSKDCAPFIWKYRKWCKFILWNCWVWKNKKILSCVVGCVREGSVWSLVVALSHRKTWRWPNVIYYENCNVAQYCSTLHSGSWNFHLTLVSSPIKCRASLWYRTSLWYRMSLWYRASLGTSVSLCTGLSLWFAQLSGLAPHIVLSLYVYANGHYSIHMFHGSHRYEHITLVLALCVYQNHFHSNSIKQKHWKQ